MAYLNNIYGNAVYTGALGGMLSGRTLSSTAADYVTTRAAAVNAAIAVDALIAFDALVTTGAGITQLAITTNTIAANEQWRAGLLHDLARSLWTGRMPSTAADGTAGAQAAALVALWTAALADLVVP